MSRLQRGAAMTYTLPSWTLYLVCLGLLATTLPACGGREKPKVSAKSQSDADAGLSTEDARGDQGSLNKTAPGNDVVADTGSGHAAAGDTAAGDTAADSQDTLLAPGDVLSDGDGANTTAEDADGGAISFGDADAGPSLDPDIYADEDVPPPVSLTQVCDDGVTPGPKVGSPCTAPGERRCVHLKPKVQPIGMSDKVHRSFCARPYYVACGKNAQGKLVWQPPQTCAGPGVSPKNTNRGEPA